MGEQSEAQAGWKQGRAAEEEWGRQSEEFGLCTESNSKDVSLWFQPERNKTQNEDRLYHSVLVCHRSTNLRQSVGADTSK